MQKSDESDRMRLSGYVQLAAHGFALPAYATGPGANAWYFAVAAVEGDHTSTIVGFERLEDEEIVPLPDHAIVVGPGDRWQDVFLWAGRVFTGTPNQIFDAVAVYQDELRAFAPLSYLDLAVAAGAPSSADLAAGALEFLEGRLGDASGAASFRELVLRPGVLIELRRQFGRVASSRLPDPLRDFVVRELEPGQFEVEMAPGTAASVGTDGAVAELSASIARFGEIIGLPLRTAKLDKRGPMPAPPEAVVHEPPPPSYETVGRGRGIMPFPNILLLVADRRAAQIARYLEPPLEVALAAGTIWGGSGYRIEHAREAHNAPVRAHDALIRVVDLLSPATSIEGFAVVVWLAGNDALREDGAEDIVKAVRSMDPDIPFLVALAPPTDGASCLLVGDRKGGELLQRCDAIIDTTLARSPFWTGQPRRSVDRRMADIVATVSVVAALDGSLRGALHAERKSKEPRVLSLHSGSGRFNIDQATASEFNAAGLGWRNGRSLLNARVVFDMRDRSGKVVDNAFVELRALRQDFERFVEAVIIEALARRTILPAPLPTSQQIPESIRRTLDNPALAVAFHVPSIRTGPIIVTAEAPDVTSLREAETQGAKLVRYTDAETIRALMDSDRPGTLPAEIRLPPLHRYRRNRGLATRGVDTRDVLRLPPGQWKEMLGRNLQSELGGQVRQYLAAIDTRGADPEVALPIPALWNAFNAGDGLAHELVDRFPRLREKNAISGKRTGDLIRAWSPPSQGVWRWVVEDGRIPAELTMLEPDEVPAQRLFFIDGDGAVPVFLLSRLFAVWARALLPSSTSWASRFQVSKTFDAFPFPWSLLVVKSGPRSPPRLHFSRDGPGATKLAEIVGDEASWLAEAIQEDGHDDRALRRNLLIREIDALLLADIQLRSDASDLDILESLIERNRLRM